MEFNTTELDGNITSLNAVKERNTMTKTANSVIILSTISFIWIAIVIGMLHKCTRMVYQIKAIATHLALTDLFTAFYFVVDASITKYAIVFEREWCIIRCHILITLSLTSISFITLFAFDGFLSLKFAMKYYSLVTKSRVNFVCFTTWVISIAVTALLYLDGFKKIISCVCFDNQGYPMISIMYNNACFLTIIIIYIYIMWHVRKQNKQLAALGNQTGNNTRSAVKIGAVVGVIFVMYFPKNIFLIYSLLSGSLVKDNVAIFTPFIYMEKLNSVVNPFVYILRFRECRMYTMRTFCWYSEKVMKKAQAINFELSGISIKATEKTTDKHDTNMIEQTNTVCKNEQNQKRYIKNQIRNPKEKTVNHMNQESN